MINSMTGFGRCRDTVNGRDITVEIKSVNSRYLDCSVKISRSVSYLEERIKPYLQARGLSRGKVDVWIGVESLSAENADLRLDEDYLKGYLSALYRLRDGFGLPDDISVMTVAQNPKLFVSKAPEEDIEKDWEEVRSVLDRAADAFFAVRAREGEALAKDIRAKLAGIRGNTEQVESLSADSILHYRERLAERIRDALSDNRITVDESRLLTECAIYSDKVAVDEELVRLRAHFDAFEEILSSGEPVGRRLDFLMQEMNREVNTTGSKCNNAEIAALVVNMKCELEKIREQIQNLE
ncbi:MAG: YicC family protein [Ruminococcaceae bacterium]|nr:YicC family protein [Oscillospiraceae bacterium]